VTSTSTTARPPAAPNLLDAGRLPIEQLAALAQREARRPRPVYGAHRWFARRLGTAFRALLVGAHLPADAAFFDGYYPGVDLTATTVLDPFVGGGTSVVEAQRLGATVIGIDVDPVACAISAFESRLHQLPDLAPAAAELAAGVGARLAPLYRTITPEGEVREVLHYFWVQVVVCGGCGRQIECHPHYQLAYQAEGSRQWVLCSHCHAVADLDRTATELTGMSRTGLTASFAYDPVGRRSRKTINGAATGYLHDGANPTQELSGTTPTANLLSGGIDEHFTRADPTGQRTFLTDALGSTIALTDPSGAVKTSYTYEPFGKTTASGETNANPSRYTGREDDGTGLYYYRARYYHPGLQRFISEDPGRIRRRRHQPVRLCGQQPDQPHRPLRGEPSR
jgi:RHS repeat-associated protein